MEECPFNRETEAQKTIDWLHARVLSLQESLETAIEFNVRPPVVSQEPMPQAVAVSTSALFSEEQPTHGDVAGVLPLSDGEFELFESSDDDQPRDVTQYPLVTVRNASSPALSSFSDLFEWVLPAGEGSDSDDVVEEEEVAATAGMEKQDFRNLGAMCSALSRESVLPTKAIKDTVKKVDNYLQQSSAKDAHFSDVE